MRGDGGFPPNDVVERMVLCYHAPSLAYRHLRQTGGLISYVVPELERRNVLEAAVQAYLGLKQSIPAAERLLKLTQRGGVSTEEQEEFDQIVADLRDLTRPCLELDVFWRSGGKERK